MPVGFAGHLEVGVETDAIQNWYRQYTVQTINKLPIWHSLAQHGITQHNIQKERFWLQLDSFKFVFELEFEERLELGAEELSQIVTG